MASVVAPSCFGVRRAWLHDVRKGMRVRTSQDRLAQMVNRCVAAGCSNTPSNCVSLFKFPSDGVLRHKWEKHVQRTRDQWKATEHSFLCSDHFTEDCFEIDSALASQFGMKKRRLKPGAVPTIFHRPSTAQVRTSEERSSRKRTTGACPMVGDDGSYSKRRRGAVEKRERHEV